MEDHFIGWRVKDFCAAKWSRCTAAPYQRKVCDAKSRPLGALKPSGPEEEAVERLDGHDYVFNELWKV